MKKNRIFISHSTKDEIGDPFVTYLTSIGINKELIFCSSRADTGIDATETSWFNQCFSKIRISDTVILIVTPNYLRSSISLLEAGATIGVKKNMIILAFPNVNIDEIKRMFCAHQIIDFSLEKYPPQFKECIKTLSRGKVRDDKDIFNKEYEKFWNILSKHQSATASIPPIGMITENENIIKPCAEYGINLITLSQVDMSEKIKSAHKIKFITTTGTSFFRRYNIADDRNNPLLFALKNNNCNIEILLGNPSGELFNEIEHLENRNAGSLNTEFSDVISALHGLTLKSKNGTIKIGNVGTSLRQTMLLIYDKDNVLVWGWATVTLPPARCNTQSLSFELKNVGNTSFIYQYENYFNAIWNKAKQNNEIIDLKDGIVECFRYEGMLALNRWSQKQKKAQENMQYAEKQDNKLLLIECSAQHPLTPNGTPGEEFKARLNRAINLYNEYRKANWKVTIYIPGSLHQIKDNTGRFIIDKIPLCESGKNFLIENGVDKEDILGQESNIKYKGKYGVYCSADECFVSSKIFFDNNYQRFISICSPAQAIRKALYYILFETLPIIYTESPQSHISSSFHNYVYEAIESVPRIIASMNDMQDINCSEATQMRKSRNPYYESD